MPNAMMLRRALFLLIVCGIVAFAVIISRLFQLQIIDHSMYEARAIEQQIRDTVITAARGAIYDTNMKILAMSANVDTIYISPREIQMHGEDPEFIAWKLSEILDVSAESILEKASDTSSWYKVIRRKVEPEVSDRVRAFKNEYNLKGVKIEEDSKRYYPYSSLAAHVIGFVGMENNGLSGIESFYNSSLTGIDGRVVRAKNAAGTDMLFTNFENYHDAQDGHSIVLTIDSTIQHFLEKHLLQAPWTMTSRTARRP
jgi:stage V sporulation protein D (sporulation-specific penicillin-binding protein)